MDGHGDLCDGCPEPNPGPGVCPLTIPTVRNPNAPGHPKTGTLVKISGAYVTGIRPAMGGSQGFHVQDESLDSFSGIFVFTGGSTPAVKVGNRVTVTGVYEEYFGLSEISNPKVVIEDAGQTLPFMPIAVAKPQDLATGGGLAEFYESMLVSVGAVVITTVNADANDYDEFAVTGNLRIDDTLSDGVVNKGLDNVCPLNSAFEPGCNVPPGKLKRRAG